MRETITVGIPFYNCSGTLLDTLRSVFSQTIDDWQILLVDDGSEDDSLSVARSVKDNRITVISDGVNRGIGPRRRQIVEMCKTPYLAWQDADDLMHPERLAKELTYLREHPEIDLVDTGTYLMDMQGHIFGINHMSTISGDYRKNVIKAPFMLNGSALGRIEMYRQYPYDLSFRRSEDWEMWCRAIATSRFGRITEPLYFRRCLTADGQIHWRKSLLELRNSRRILLKHGPGVLGWSGTLAAVGEQYTRDVLRSLLCIARLECLLPRNLKARNQPDDLSLAQGTLECILDTPLPRD